MTGRRTLLTVGVVVAAIIGIAAVIALLAARDDATIAPRSGPGVARTATTNAPVLPGDRERIRPGNIVLFYSDERLTRRLGTLARDIAGPPSAELLAAGQAITVRRRPNQRVAVVALSATRRLEASGPGDPALRTFIEYWLGRDPS